MIVNGLKLPASFVELLDRSKPFTQWVSKGDVDAYGHEYSNDLILLDSLAKIEEKTNNLPHRFHVADREPEDYEMGTAQCKDYPGFTPYIADFSQIVALGRTSSGEDYCLDFRDNRDEPSIVLWGDGYWRRLAPNFATFICLFKLYGT